MRMADTSTFTLMLMFPRTLNSFCATKFGAAGISLPALDTWPAGGEPAFLGVSSQPSARQPSRKECGGRLFGDA